MIKSPKKVQHLHKPTKIDHLAATTMTIAVATATHHKRATCIIAVDLSAQANGCVPPDARSPERGGQYLSVR